MEKITYTTILLYSPSYHSEFHPNLRIMRRLAVPQIGPRGAPAWSQAHWYGALRWRAGRWRAQASGHTSGTRTEARRWQQEDSLRVGWFRINEVECRWACVIMWKLYTRDGSASRLTQIVCFPRFGGFGQVFRNEFMLLFASLIEFLKPTNKYKYQHTRTEGNNNDHKIILGIMPVSIHFWWYPPFLGPWTIASGSGFALCSLPAPAPLRISVSCSVIVKNIPCPPKLARPPKPRINYTNRESNPFSPPDPPPSFLPSPPPRPSLSSYLSFFFS